MNGVGMLVVSLRGVNFAFWGAFLYKNPILDS